MVSFVDDADVQTYNVAFLDKFFFAWYSVYDFLID